MLRRIHATLSLASALLLLLVIALWVRSLSRADTFTLRSATSYPGRPTTKWLVVRGRGSGLVLSAHLKVVPAVDVGNPPWREDVPAGYVVPVSDSPVPAVVKRGPRAHVDWRPAHDPGRTGGVRAAPRAPLRGVPRLPVAVARNRHRPRPAGRRERPHPSRRAGPTPRTTTTSSTKTPTPAPTATSACAFRSRSRPSSSPSFRCRCCRCGSAGAPSVKGGSSPASALAAPTTCAAAPNSAPSAAARA